MRQKGQGMGVKLLDDSVLAGKHPPPAFLAPYLVFALFLR